MEINKILERVSEATEVPVEEILGSSHIQHIQDAKKMAINLIYTKHRLTLCRIGKIFGITHVSVHNAIQKHNNLFNGIKQYRQIYEKIDKHIDNNIYTLDDSE